MFWRSDTRRRSDVLPEAYEPAPGTAGLIFDPVSESDAGRYTCVARNDRGVTEENVDLMGKIMGVFCFVLFLYCLFLFCLLHRSNM